MRFFLILVLSTSSFLIEARMYQWVEPGVETTQLSGKPPAWYRSNNAGPRIFVFENGRLVDDTAVEVSDEVRQRLRQEAFILAEEDRQKAKEKIVKANEMKQKFEDNKSNNEESAVEDEVVTEELLTDTLFPDEAENIDESEDDMNMDELRKIIADWEASQSESARKALE